jgi:hypothetical protein
MKVRRWVGVVVALVACGSEPKESRPEVGKSTPPSAAPALPAQPAEPVRSVQDILNDSDVKLALQQDFQQLLGRLKYKPDPYAVGPSCVSEARVTVRDDLLLSVRLKLVLDAAQQTQVGSVDYFVSDTKVKLAPAREPSQGTPRLELVHADGKVDAVDFVGLRDPSRPEDDSEQPRQPASMLAWLASAPLDRSVIAHRIVLDGRVLREVKRPEGAPRLSEIRCAEQKDLGVKLSWNTGSQDASAPLMVDVLRHGPLGFVEELPFADARKVSGFTIAKAKADPRDAVLLVSITDTFRLVTRGVLVPKEAL